MRWQSGLLRAWVVASVFWFGGWLAYIVHTCGYLSASASDPNPIYVCPTSPIDGALTEWSKFGITDWLTVAAWGAGVPLVVLALGVGLVWTYLGFRPQPKSGH